MELAFTALLTGLFSSAHCVAMCGGILSALNLAPKRVIPIRAQGSEGAMCMRNGLDAMAAAMPLQLAYNLGRIGSYAVAGAIAGAVGTVALGQDLLPLQLALALFANLLIVLLAFHLAGYGRALNRLERAGMHVWRFLQPLAARVFPIETPSRALAAGMAWGWLPCGLVYSVLALALLSGDAANGALVMAAFGLGTLPALLMAGAFLKSARDLISLKSVRVFAAVMLLMLAVWNIARLPQVKSAIQAGLLCFN